MNEIKELNYTINEDETKNDIAVQDENYTFKIKTTKNFNTLYFNTSKGIYAKNIRSLLRKDLKGKYKYHLELVLFNLYSIYLCEKYLNKKCVVKYSRKAKDYSETNQSYRTMMKVIDDLKELDFLTYTKGTYNAMTSQGLRGYLEITDYCRDFFYRNDIETIDYTDTLELIQLRIDEKKIKFNDTKSIEKIRRFLLMFNNAYKKYDVFLINPSSSYSNNPPPNNTSNIYNYNTSYIVTGNTFKKDNFLPNLHSSYLTDITVVTKISDPPLKRVEKTGIFIFRLSNGKLKLHCVYNDNWGYGGRFYSSVQIYKKLNRKRMIVDNEKTTSFDYSGMHPRLLYHLEKKAYYGDPYAIDGLYRDDVKLVFQYILNCKSKKSVIATINKYKTATSGLKPSEFINRILGCHKDIKKYFFTGYGLRLMHYDALIALSIMKRFFKKDLFVCPIHDGFIVKEKDGQYLKETMIDLYEKQIGFTPIVKKEY